jgi:hypothetical protein
MRRSDLVGSSFYLDDLDVLHQTRDPSARCINGEDAVLCALDDEETHVDLRQIGAKVGLPGRHAFQGGVR